MDTPVFFLKPSVKCAIYFYLIGASASPVIRRSPLCTPDPQMGEAFRATLNCGDCILIPISLISFNPISYPNLLPSNHLNLGSPICPQLWVENPHSRCLPQLPFRCQGKQSEWEPGRTHLAGQRSLPGWGSDVWSEGRSIAALPANKTSISILRLSTWDGLPVGMNNTLTSTQLSQVQKKNLTMLCACTCVCVCGCGCVCVRVYECV